MVMERKIRISHLLAKEQETLLLIDSQLKSLKKNRATIRNHSIEVVSAVSTVDRRMKETET